MDERQQLERFLAKTVLFSVLPEAVLSGIAAILTRISLAKGEVLFSAGESGETAFLVRSGLVQIVDSTTPDGRVLSEAGRGDHLGELAALTGEPRAAGAVAAVDSVLYAIPGAMLRGLLQEQPILYARLSLSLMRNLQARTKARPGGARTCALVGAGSAADASLALVVGLAGELAGLGGERIAVLDCLGAPRSTSDVELPDALADVTQTLGRLVMPSPVARPEGVSLLTLGKDCAADAPMADLLAELQRRYDRALVHAVLPFTEPAARAVAQCDARYWIRDAADTTAEAACAGALAAIARLVPAPGAPRTLALVPDAGHLVFGAQPATPSARRVPCHREALGGGSFYSPAARRVLRAVTREISGRQTALVLGAGGAKGFAHLGALRVFERHGIEFDAVAGTSIGAIVGAFVAIGWPLADVETLFMGIAANPWKVLFDPRVPTEAFFRSKKKTELIGQYCGDMRIEDLPMPFFAVAGDLTALVPVVFRSGPLAMALDASSAIPTVFRPVRHGQQVLVDGWVCDPLPAGVARSAGIERVVAVDLSPHEGDAPRRPGSAPAGLGGRFRILAIAMRAMELASREHVARSLPLVDVLIRPDLDGFSSTDLDAAAEMCERGERAAEAALPQLTARDPALTR